MNPLRFLLRHLRSLRHLHRGIRVLDYGTGNDVRIVGHHRWSTVRIFGSDCYVAIDTTARLDRVTACVLGDRCFLGIGARLTRTMVYLAGNGAGIEVGAGTTFRGELITTDDKAMLTVGRDCMMGGGVTIRCGDGHPVYQSWNNSGRINTAHGITVGNHVWAGEGSLILKNVIVGDGAIIAARAVVTRDVSARSMVAGVPARLVKKDIRWER